MSSGWESWRARRSRLLTGHEIYTEHVKRAKRILPYRRIDLRKRGVNVSRVHCTSPSSKLGFLKTASSALQEGNKTNALVAIPMVRKKNRKSIVYSHHPPRWSVTVQNLIPQRLERATILTTREGETKSKKCEIKTPMACWYGICGNR